MATKKDLASVDRDLEAELDALSQPELRRLAKEALRTIYYDRARCANYMRENKEKRREYYFTVLKPKRERAKLEAGLCANYMRENKEKRREYYLTVLKPKRERAKLEAASRAAPAPVMAGREPQAAPAEERVELCLEVPAPGRA